MEELSERDLYRVRVRFIDLIKSFFVEEPDAEKMSRWRGTFSALQSEQISPRFDNAVNEMVKALSEKSLEKLQEEYYQLFTDPFEKKQVETTASYYLNGRGYSQALVDLRGLMNEAGLLKDEAISDPEDSLVVMLDIFASLIEEEKISGGEKVQSLQARLLEDFLEPTATKLSAVLKESEHADFYYLCSRVLEGYLDLEKGLVGFV